MKLLLKTDSAPRPQAKRFPAAHLIIVLLNVALGLVSVAGAILTVKAFGLEGDVQTGVMVIGASIAMTVALAPALLAPAWVHASTTGKIAGFAIALGFMALDAGFMANGTNQLELLGRQSAIQKANEAITTARAELNAIPLPDANGAIRRASTYETVVTLATNKLSAAQDELKKATTTSFPLELVMVATSILQICFFFSRAWLTSITVRMQKAALADRETKKESKSVSKGVITRAVNKALRQHGIDPLKAVA